MWGETKDEKPKADSNSKSLTVETVDNHVYYYARVDGDRTLALMKSIRELDARLRTERVSRQISEDAPMTPIWLHIQSYGGGLHEGLGAANQLSQVASPVHSIVEGICASAGTLLSLACTKRFILPDAFMLVHQFSSIMWGTYEEFKDDMKLQDMLIERLRNFYVAKTLMGDQKVEEVLKHDSWFSAAQCVEAGLVDEILR